MSPPNNKGPWGNLPPGGGSGGGSGGGGGTPPDLDALLKRGQEKLKGFFPDGQQGPQFWIFLGAVLLALWFSTGIYKIEPNEQGVILRFGAFQRVADPGLNYHLPQPIERVMKVPVTTIQRVEIGARTVERGRKLLEESLMLTGDENIVDIDFEVQWKVQDPMKFLFHLRDQEETVKNVAESAMREVVGRMPIASVLTEGRSRVETETKQIIQQVMDEYGAGVEIVRLQMREVQPPAAVIDAFRDVQTARADMERARNEAEAYRNDIIPRARGDAARVVQEAEAYQKEIVANAEGEAGRFVSIMQKYKLAKDVTRRRMYLETLEAVMKGMDKIIIDRKAGSGVVPYLPLDALAKPKGDR